MTTMKQRRENKYEPNSVRYPGKEDDYNIAYDAAYTASYMRASRVWWGVVCAVIVGNIFTLPVMGLLVGLLMER